MRRCLTLFVSLTLAAPAFAFEHTASTPAATATPAVAPAVVAPAPQKPAPVPAAPAPTLAPVAAKPLPPLPTPAQVESAEAAPEAASHAVAATTKPERKKAVRIARRKPVEKAAEPPRIVVSDSSRQYLHSLGHQLDDALAK
ncbi:hypothetical protein PWR05_35975 [Paraburkholderia sp. A2RI-6]|uniref:hypothetical protein n=1 Tax=Paraburkholderia sp. A2RI-6 TaxID=3028371 RepID=UPI003B778A31